MQLTGRAGRALLACLPIVTSAVSGSSLGGTLSQRQFLKFFSPEEKETCELLTKKPEKRERWRAEWLLWGVSLGTCEVVLSLQLRGLGLHQGLAKRLLVISAPGNTKWRR